MKQINVILGGKNYKNKGIFFPENNSLKLLKGACIRKTGGSTYKFENIRRERISKYCHEETDFFILDKDVVFDTPTAAAKFCAGNEVNCPSAWRTTDGIKIKDLKIKYSNFG